jgi:hypothetical protein
MEAITIAYPFAALKFASNQISFLMNNALGDHISELNKLRDIWSNMPPIGGDGAYIMISMQLVDNCNLWDGNVQDLYNRYSGLADAIVHGSHAMQQQDNIAAGTFTGFDHSTLA